MNKIYILAKIFKNRMMKKFIAVFALIGIITLGCNESSNNESDGVDSTATETVEAISLEALYADANAHIDDTVKITGLVDHICEHGGKKIFLVQDELNIKIFAKEKFEEEIVGKDVIVNAVLRETRIDSAYLAEWEEEVKANHEAEDEESVAAMKRISHMRDSVAGTDDGFLSHYFMDFVSFQK